MLCPRYAGLAQRNGINAINNGNNTGNVTAAGLDSVHWLVLDAGTRTVLAQGLINDATHDFFQPSIAVNPNGDIVIGYNRAGTNGTADRLSSYASVGHIDGANNVTFGTPIMLTLGGVDNYTDGFNSPPSRWGDYSATTLDPSDPTKFWTIQEVPLADGVWGTQISALQVVPEPSTVLLCIVLGGAGLVAGTRRRRPVN